MATKKIKVGKDYDFSITKKSKDTVYVFKNETVAKNTNINIKYDDNIAYHTCAKSGTDLYIVCEFYDWETQTSKVILNTVKDYFKYNSEKPDLITVNEEIVNTAYAHEFVSGTVEDFAYGSDFIGDKKNTTYNLNKAIKSEEGYGYFDWIEDLGGKDVYNITETNVGIGSDEYFSGVEILDYSGNDKYNIHPSSLPNNPAYFVGSRFDIYDMKGDDKYTIENERLSGGTGEIIDLAGDDKYSITTSSGISIEDYKGNDNYVLKTTQDVGLYDGYFKWHEDDTITVTGGNDKYEITGSNEIYINEVAGKDKYTIDNSSNIMISDGYNPYDDIFPGIVKSGNDTYELNEASSVKIDDYDGKDKYTINESYDVEITDYVGSDKYTISGSSEDIEINDHKGNDKYTLSGEFEDIDIDDYEGDDKYTISGGDGDVGITDYIGKDKYTLNNAYDVTVMDIKDADTYKVTDSSYIEIYDGYIPEQGGNDKYVITGSNNIEIIEVGGNDTYSFTNVEGIRINENKGDDTYSFKNVVNGDPDSFYITEYVGNDKYTITASDFLSIRDNSGDDKWTVTNSKSIEITDNYGSDTYSVAKASDVIITDHDATSNDTYKMALAGRVVINDFGGDADKLTLTSKAKNLVYMANFNANGSGVSDGSLIIFDKTKGGYTYIANYFDTTEVDGITIFDGAGEGCIESMKAGKSSLTSKINTFSSADNISALAETVANWLDQNTDYDSVYELLSSDDTQSIKDFIAFAQNA